MAGRRRCLAIAAAIAVTVAAVAAVALAAPGRAAPYVPAPMLSVSTSTPCKGATLTVVGTNFVPGTVVTLRLRPGNARLGSVFVGAAGGFAIKITLPKVTGTFQLVAAGPPAPGNPNTAQATLHIRSCMPPTPTPSHSAVPTPSHSGPIPITGYSGAGPAGGVGYALSAGVAAVACLVLGGGLLAWRRRRKHAA